VQKKKRTIFDPIKVALFSEVGSKNQCQIRNQHGLKPLKSDKETIGSDGYLLARKRASNDQIYNLDILFLEMESG
jgi:hypothetical protein